MPVNRSRAEDSPEAGDSTSTSFLDQLREPQNQTAWARFNEDYGPFLDRILSQFGLQRSEIDDLRQEVMLVAVRRFPDFVHSGNRGALRTWLRSVTRNVLLSNWRKKKPEQIDSELAEQLAVDDSDLSRIWDRDFAEYLRRRINVLLDTWELEQRFEPHTLQVFRLNILRQRPTAEVAQTLNLSRGVVASAAHRVLQAVRHEMEHDAPVDSES